MKKIISIFCLISFLFLMSCVSPDSSNDAIYFDNLLSSNEYKNKSLSELNIDEALVQESFIDFEGKLFEKDAKGRFEVKAENEKTVIKKVVIIVEKENIKPELTQEQFFSMYGKYIANGMDEMEDGSSEYWERYVDGAQLILYKNNSNQDYYEIIFE